MSKTTEPKYVDKNGDEFILVEIRKHSVLLKPMGKHSYVEFSSFSEALDPTMKAGHIELMTPKFESDFVLEEQPVLRNLWEEHELLLAYFVAKFGADSLKLITGMSMLEITERMHRTMTSFNMQVAVFRHLLCISGYQLSVSSKTQRKIVADNNNVTYTQLKKNIWDIVKDKLL